MKTEDFYRGRDIRGTEERKRLEAADVLQTWRHWGPYLSERQWGTVRECYDVSCNAWQYFVHDDARSRAYRWGEDGIAGISDLHQYLCFGVALWNGSDPIIKERLFGLTNPEGNHGEDVKEYYFYLENTPTHSYMKYLYRYPYRYPYEDLVNNSHSKDPLEYELIDTGALDQNRFFDVTVEYAKNSPEDYLIRITATNQGNELRTLKLLPTLWFRNRWSWGDASSPKPSLKFGGTTGSCQWIETSDVISIDTETNRSETLLTKRWLYFQTAAEVLFTENETNFERFNEGTNSSRYVKDGINNYIVSHGIQHTVNPAQIGTKASPVYRMVLAPGATATVKLRLVDGVLSDPFGAAFDQVFQTRISETDQFYDAVSPYDRNKSEEADRYRVQRQAFAGMLWGKQFYHFIVHRWLHGDLVQPSDAHRNDAAMTPWIHMYCKDILSMPDKWEYPWFAAWDLSFHTTTLALIDPAFAKHQLELLVMEFYQHPDGALPAYEWDFSKVNPPVQAWAAWEVYSREKEMFGTGDVSFLERIFNKLNMNFTWWVNRVDRDGNDVFEGGFLGLDNIRIFETDPQGEPIEEADGTAWMCLFCLNMFKMANELCNGAVGDDAFQYKDSMRKYLQHFMFLCDAINKVGDEGLWDDDAQFFMDCANHYGRLKVFSLVGLVPLFAIVQITHKVTEPNSFYDLYGFLTWYKRNRSDLAHENDSINLEDLLNQVDLPNPPAEISGTVSVVEKERLVPILHRMLKTDEFLSSRGIRSLSQYHLRNPHVDLQNTDGYDIWYEPAESNRVKILGGNSNWRGPIWMPINYLIIQSLRKFYDHLGDGFVVQCPSDSGITRNLDQIADDLSERVVGIFLRDPATQRRPVFGGQEIFQNDPKWRDYILFYEYFHGGDEQDRYAGAGLGANHQTGWTGLVANLLQEIGIRRLP